MEIASGGYAPSLSPGTRLDAYELLAEIGRGRTSAIWVARLRSSRGIEKLVALKAIHAPVATDPAFREAFLEEARKASAITHPNVAQILDLGERDDLVYLVSEYVDGDSLAELRNAAEAKKQKVPPAIVLRILADTCAGLHAAHLLRDRHGKLLNVVHGDVCAQSILVSTSGVTKLIDFGVAKTRARLSGGPNGSLLELGAATPTPPIAQRLDRHADIWAVGAILHHYLAHLLVGTKANGDEPARAPSVPGAVAELVHRALSVDPVQRFATAAEMQGAIEAAMVALGIPTTTANVAAFAAEHLADRAAARGLEIEQAIEAVPRISITANDSDSIGPLAHSLSPPSSGLALAPRAQLLATLPPAPPDDVASNETLLGTPQPSQALYSNPPFGPLAPMQGAWRSRVVVGSAVLAAVASVVALLAISGVRIQRNGDQAAAAANSSGVVAAPPAPKPKCASSMVEIPGGKFFMGSDEDLDLEKPAHHVTLAPYCIDRFEVTTEDYKACSDAGDCKRAATENKWPDITAKDSKVYDPLCNAREPMARAKHPINCVDWQMAARYCEARGGRLPTEAEWEFAARGPDGRKYPWGDEEPSALDLNACGAECVAWGKKNKVELESMYEGDDGWPTTAPVGSFPGGKSRYGVNDVMGNVWEWTADYFAPYAPDTLVDPKGPPRGDERVIRGGAWNGSYTSWVRPTFRYKNPPDTRSHGIGFRCARSVVL
jgi:formylglycine-generating enzyme required for sulfatase activity/serine/threonine protein kinase